MGASRAKTVVALTGAITLVLAGCGGDEQAGEGDGTARKGGTLRLVGQDGVDHVDTAAAYYTASYTLERALTRQLVTYPADRDFERANDRDPAEWLRHLVLPWLTLALVQAAAYVRLTRGSPLDVLQEDYIRTARAKGLRESRVTTVHGLRASLTPVVTQFGIDIGTLVGGVIVTETVFSLPGLGQLAISSVTTQDRPVVISIVLLGATFIVVANILVDAAYAWLDPRVRRH